MNGFSSCEEEMLRRRSHVTGKEWTSIVIISQ